MHVKWRGTSASLRAGKKPRRTGGSKKLHKSNPAHKIGWPLIQRELTSQPQSLYKMPESGNGKRPNLSFLQNFPGKQICPGMFTNRLSEFPKYPVPPSPVQQGCPGSSLTDEWRTVRMTPDAASSNVQPSDPDDAR